MLGSLNMDLVVRTARLPAPGETILGRDFVTSQGGKGANQAIAAARGGAAVSMIGAVGTDGFGDELLAALDADGVATRLVRRVGGSSGIAVITVDDDAENTIVVAQGANGELTGLSDDELAVIVASDLLITQLEVPIETVTAGARAAAGHGVAVLLNVSPARPLPDELVAAVTLAVVNEGEETVYRRNGSGPRTACGHDPRGRRSPLPGTGRDGAQRRAHRGSGPSTRPGAGDAFTGALAVAWAQGAEPGTGAAGCLRRGRTVNDTGRSGKIRSVPGGHRSHDRHTAAVAGNLTDAHRQ